MIMIKSRFKISYSHLKRFLAMYLAIPYIITSVLVLLGETVVISNP